MISPLFQIKWEKETKDYGLFSLEPLAQGFGHTLGNALRRVLLSNIRGAAITQIKIQGVKHRFSTLEGLKEDIIEFILNLKKVVITYEGERETKLEIDKVGPGEILAADIKTPANITIVNPDLVLGHLATKNNRLRAEMIVKTGYGYLTAEEQEAGKLGVIPIDALFSPVRRVNFTVESTRVGRRTDLNRLIIEIFTNGASRPSQVLKEAANILVEYFKQVAVPKRVPTTKKAALATANEILKLTVEEIDLPTRIANTLRRGGFGTVEDLTQATLTDLLRVKNLGGKSIQMIKDALSAKGLSLREA